MLPAAIKRALAEVIANLEAAGEPDKIEKLLTNPRFIQDRIIHFGLEEIFQDLKNTSSSNLGHVRRALKRSEHVIRGHPEQTTQQLYLRLPHFNWYAENSQKRAKLLPLSFDHSPSNSGESLLQTIPTSWKRRGFADRIFPEFVLANDQDSVFLTFPDDCKVIQYSLNSGEIIDTQNLKPNFSVYGDEADLSYPIIEAIAKLSDERFLISVTAQNADTFEVEHTLVECDFLRKRLSRFWRGSEHPIRHIFVAGNSLILVTTREVVFTTVDSFNTESNTNRLAIETHENAWIQDAYLHENFLALTSTGFVSVLDIISRKLLHKMLLADFLQKEPEWHDIRFGFSNPIPIFKDSDFLVSYDRRQFLLDAEQGLLIRELPSTDGRYLVESSSRQILIANNNDLFLLDMDSDESIPTLTGTGGDFLQIQMLDDQKQCLTFNTNGDFQLWHWGQEKPKHPINRTNLGSSIEGICPIGGGDWIAWTSDGQVYLKQNANCKVVLLAEYSKKIVSIKSHPWHPMIVITAKGLIDTWSLETLKRLIGYQFSEFGSITSSLSEDGFRIYAITMDGIITCSVFQQRSIILSYERISDENVRILEWPGGQYILIKCSSGRTLLIDQNNRELIYDCGGSGSGGFDGNQPTNLCHLKESSQVCFGLGNTIETWNVDFTRKRTQIINRFESYPLSVLHLKKPDLLLIDDGLYLDETSGAKLKLENFRSKLHVVDHWASNGISITVNKNTLRVSATLNPGNSVSLTLDSEISDAKFIYGSDMILVGDKIGNVTSFRLDLPPDFAEMDKALTTSERTEIHENFVFDVKLPRPKVFYPTVDRSEYCFFCNEHKPKQSIDVMEKSICLACVDLTNSALETANSYSSTVYKLRCTICHNHADKEEEEELKFYDILFQRLCEDCVKRLKSKISNDHLRLDEVATQESQAKRSPMFRKLFQRNVKRNPPLHWLYRNFKKNDPVAIEELTVEIGSEKIAKKIGEAFATKQIRSLSYNQVFENIDDEIKALCMVLEDSELEFEKVNWLLERIDHLETPYTLYRFAATVSDYPYDWADHAERAAHRALEINSEFARAWRVIADVRYEMKMDVLGAANAYVHYSRCKNLDADILIEAAEFELKHFMGARPNAVEYLEKAETVIEPYQTWNAKKISELREKYSDKLDMHDHVI